VVLKALKQRVSRDLRRKKRRASAGQLQFSFLRGSESLPRFWQSRFYGFNVYSQKKKREKLEYMHANPVKRGLVRNPGAWICSSYLFYEKGESGLVPVDPVD
jgi:putative transposase